MLQHVLNDEQERRTSNAHAKAYSLMCSFLCYVLIAVPDALARFDREVLNACIRLNQFSFDDSAPISTPTGQASVDGSLVLTH